MNYQDVFQLSICLTTIELISRKILRCETGRVRVFFGHADWLVHDGLNECYTETFPWACDEVTGGGYDRFQS